MEAAPGARCMLAYGVIALRLLRPLRYRLNVPDRAMQTGLLRQTDKAPSLASVTGDAFPVFFEEPT
jgi:hypothetical protein